MNMSSPGREGKPVRMPSARTLNPAVGKVRLREVNHAGVAGKD